MPTCDQVVELTVNLDDVTPQVIGHVQTTLLEAGALDCWTHSIFMKKQRPGICLSLLCKPENAQNMAQQVLTLTGSFGVRQRTWDRLILDRHHETVDTRYGPLRIKVGSLQGQVLVRQPEYEDAKALAEQQGLAIRHVLAAAQEAL